MSHFIISLIEWYTAGTSPIVVDSPSYTCVWFHILFSFLCFLPTNYSLLQLVDNSGLDVHKKMVVDVWTVPKFQIFKAIMFYIYIYILNENQCTVTVSLLVPFCICVFLFLPSCNFNKNTTKLQNQNINFIYITS